MVYFAAFSSLLYAGVARHVVIGIPVANRTRVEVAPLIGFFVNSFVLRSDCRAIRLCSI